MLDKAGTLWHPSARMSSELPKAYEPQAVEAKWYAAWLDGKCFEADPSSAQGGLFDRHSAAQCHRHPAPRPCPEQRAAGHPRPPRAAGGQGSAVAARHRPRRHRHPGEGRARVARNRGQDPPRPRPRRVPQARLGFQGQTRRHHHQAAQAPRLLVRLEPRALHHGRGLLEVGEPGLRRAVQTRPHLSRQAHRQLVPGFSNRTVRRGGDHDPAALEVVFHEIRTRRCAGRVSGNLHHPSGNADGRRGGGRESEGPALFEIHRTQGLAAVSACGNPGHRRRPCGHRVRHRRAENHSRPRQGGLRDRHAPSAWKSSTFSHPTRHIHCPECPDLDGLDRFVARKKAAAKLEAMGLLIKVEEYENNVGFSERAHVPIEPRISMQWFLKYPCVKRSRRRRGQRRHQVPARALGENLRPLDGKPPGLVHQPPTLVGPSDPGVVSQGQTRGAEERRVVRNGRSSRRATSTSASKHPPTRTTGCATRT